MRIHYLQHVPFEGLGSIEPWAIRSGHVVTCTRLYANESCPAVDEIDWLIVMGGPMSVNDTGKHPWLSVEKAFVRRAVDAGMAVLGICLGAQLIAKVLGSDVHPNAHKEIGWFEVSKSKGAGASPAGAAFSGRTTAFHWHGETFDLPPGAVHLAQSEACRHQAFAYQDRVIGLQYHLETTPASAAALIENCANELVEGPFIQTADELLAEASRFDRINAEMERLLNYLQQRIMS